MRHHALQRQNITRSLPTRLARAAGQQLLFVSSLVGTAGLFSLSTVVLTSAAAPGAFAQSMTDKAVEAEIEFARGLARDWAFVDMAQSVLDDVADADLSERMKEELSLVRCEVFTNGARATFDPLERNVLLERAIESYEAYIKDNEFASNRPAAEQQLVELAITYARSVDIALKDAVGEEAEAMRTRKVDVLQGAIARTETLIEGLAEVPSDERTPEQNTQRLVLMLQKGDMYARIAATNTDDTFFGDQAVEVLSNLIFDAGEGTELALRAQMSIGDVFYNRGEIEDAIEFYEGTVNSVIPMDEEERNDPDGLDWKNVPFDIKQKRFLYVELGVPGVQKCARALGDLERGINTGLFMNNLYRKEGFQLSSLGYEAMIEMAETFLEAGGYIGGNAAEGEAQWFATEEDLSAAGVRKRDQKTAVAFALDLARQVATEAAGTQQGVEAGKLLSRINERPEIELPIEQLLQAALSKFRTEENDAAVAAYYDVLARMDELDPAERATLGARTYNGLGNALRAQGRDLDAAMAFREALLNYRDPEWDSSNAKRYAALMRSWARSADAAADPVVEKLVTEAEDFVIELGETGSVDVIKFSQAEKELKRDNYEVAIEKYRLITIDEGMYEPAVIRIGQCMLALKQFKEARDHFDTYLNEHVTNPTYDPTTPIAEDRRHQSQGKAIYNAAFIDHLLAASKYKKSEEKDVSGYQAVIDRLKGFKAEYSDVGSVAIKAEAMLADSYAKTGAADEAEAVVSAMIKEHPDAKETARASLGLYTAYSDRRSALEAAEAPDAEAIAKATRDMARALGVYNNITPGVPYNYLRNESNLWQEILEWENSKAALKKTLARFLEDEEYKDKVITQVVPDLAEAMLETGEVAEAKDLLSPYVIGEDAPLKTRTPTILMSRAMMGSIVGSGSNVKTTPGAGGTPEEFEFITKRLTSIENSITSWTCEWYEAKLAAMYAYYVWGQDDAKRLVTAKNLMDDIATFMSGDTQFALIDEACMLEEVDPQMKRRLGGGVLAAHYRWLYGKTR